MIKVYYYQCKFIDPVVRSAVFFIKDDKDNWYRQALTIIPETLSKPELKDLLKDISSRFKFLGITYQDIKHAYKNPSKRERD